MEPVLFLCGNIFTDETSGYFYLFVFEDLVHPPEKLYEDYLGAQKFENIFSINIGPNYEGKIRDVDVKTLKQVGEMIRNRSDQK